MNVYFFLQQDDLEEDVGSISDIDISSDEEDSSSQKFVDNERENSLAVYESLVEITRDIPLEKVRLLHFSHILQILLTITNFVFKTI